MANEHFVHGQAHRELTEHEQELEKEAHFTGPPVEDPILDLLFCPFRTFPKRRTEEHNRTKEQREILAHIIHDYSHDPAILWFGLFTDLIFVAVIVQFSNQYKTFFTNRDSYDMPDGEFYLRITAETILFFFAFFTIWLELAQANTRFVNMKGLLDDSLLFLYLCGIIVMAVQMNSDIFLLEHRAGFMSGMITCYLSMLLLHIAYYTYIPSASQYCQRRMWSYFLTLIILVVGLMCGTSMDNETTGTWVAAFAIWFGSVPPLVVALVSFRVDPRFQNWTLEYFKERFGILVMIVTGESILALVVGGQATEMVTYTATTHPYVFDAVKSTYITLEDLTTTVTRYEYNSYGYTIYSENGAFFQGDTEGNFREYIVVMFAFATMYIMKNIYFESEAEYEEHALLEEGHPGSVIWVGTHFPLTFSLLGCGIGYRLLFNSIHDDESKLGYRLILGFCAFLAICSMLMIRSAHDKFIFPIQSLMIRLPTALMIPIGSFFIKPTVGYVLWVFGFVAISWVYDLTIMESLEIKKRLYDFHEEHLARQEPSGSFADKCITVCGCDDKEFAGAFHGPKHEGGLWLFIMDVVLCRLIEEPRSAKGILPDDYVLEIEHPHHHGHGHGDHSAEEGQDHGWFGEFTDLLFVAVIIKFADQIKYKQSTMYQRDDDLVLSDWEHARIYLDAAVIFGAFFTLWLELQHCLIRFKNMPGIFDDLMYFFFLCGVIGMAIQMNRLEYLLERRLAFCIWFAFSLICLAFLHVRLREIDDAEKYSNKRIMAYTVGSVFSLIGGVSPPEPAVFLMLLSYAIILLVSLNSFRVWQESKPNKHLQMEYIERFGLIVMITTGESILALIVADFEQTLEHYAIVLIAFFTMFLLKSIYFESHSETPDMHALAEGQIPGSVLWAFMHAPCAFFLLGCGVGYKMLISYADHEYAEKINRYTLGASICGALLTIYIIRTAHNKFILPVSSILLRAPIAFAAPVGAAFIEAPLAYVTWCCMTVVLSFALDQLLIVSLRFEIHDDFKRSEQVAQKVFAKTCSFYYV